MTGYFFDAWAILDYLRGNPAYRPYFQGTSGATSRWALAEVYFKLLEWGRPEAQAQASHRRFAPMVVEFDDWTLFRAMAFRKAHPDPRQQGRYRFSYADALGYTLAVENDLLFLTGDPDFRGMTGVEWVG